jgi:hypothetical protein
MTSLPGALSPLKEFLVFVERYGRLRQTVPWIEDERCGWGSERSRPALD